MGRSFGPKESRFTGHGNVTINGHSRGWQLRCIRCQRASKIVQSHHMPPHQLRKKFALSGWQVGSTPNHDVCPECQIKTTLKPQVEIAKKTMNDIVQPLVRSPDRTVHFNDLMAAVPHVTTEQARELITALRARLPTQAPRARRVKEPPPTPQMQSEYEQWLSELEGN